MKINIERHGDQFNVQLSSAEGREPFLVVKGCRIVDGSKGKFVSWPARKKDDGTWWNHLWASEGFAKAVLDEALKSQPAPQRDKAPRRDEDKRGEVPF
jgi:DNA-binding cell septation regulator SpoVG